jgi:hypothetical protein
MARSDFPTGARRSWFVPVCAMSALLLGAGLFSACLNPMPDDFPSSADGPVNVAGSGGSSSVVGSAGTAAGTENDNGTGTGVDGSAPPDTEGGADAGVADGGDLRGDSDPRDAGTAGDAGLGDAGPGPTEAP